MKWFPGVCLACLLSCTKNGIVNDHELPVVTLLTPADNEVVAGGSTVPITASLSDNQLLTEVHVHISNVATGSLLIDIHRNPGAPTYALSESFTAQSGIQYKIQVIAKDAAANENRATVTIGAN